MKAYVDGWEMTRSHAVPNDSVRVTVKLLADPEAAMLLVDLFNKNGTLTLEPLYRDQALQIVRDLATLPARKRGPLRARARTLLAALDAAAQLRETAQLDGK